MTRRQMLAAMGAAAAQRGLAQTALKFRGLDHIEFTVKDVEKSTEFYAQLFGGADVMKNRTTTRRYIKLGASYMAIDRADAPRIDHVCLGVENFNIDEVHAYLTAKGLTYRDYPSGRDTGVTDPDGTRVQLAAAGGWTSIAAQTASPEPRNVGGLLHPLDLAAIQIRVTELNSGLSHYGRLLGPTLTQTYSVGSGTIEISSGPGGYSKFAIRVQDMRATDIRQKIVDLGGRIQAAANDVIQFLDFDGHLVHIATAPVAISPA